MIPGGNGKTDAIGEQIPEVEGVAKLPGRIIKDVALDGLLV